MCRKGNFENENKMGKEDYYEYRMVIGRDAAPFPISKMDRGSADASEQDAFDTVPLSFTMLTKKRSTSKRFCGMLTKQSQIAEDTI